MIPHDCPWYSPGLTYLALPASGRVELLAVTKRKAGIVVHVRSDATGAPSWAYGSDSLWLALQHTGVVVGSVFSVSRSGAGAATTYHVTVAKPAVSRSSANPRRS